MTTTQAGPAVKTCTKCQQTKSLDDFSLKASSRDGRSSQCKACRNKHMAATYPQNSTTIRAKRVARYATIRARLIALKLTLRCVDCSWQPTTAKETVRLEFDHRDPATKHRSGSSAFDRSWSWARIQREIALCDPRCKTCHGKRSTALGHRQIRRTEVQP